ncbi:MAG: hypothetical protein IKR85_09595 [Clostridia bacterium]|nr:hypothetical protein [Clostridia bacterium]
MTLRPIEERDRALIENLFNLYRNDLSAYCDDFTSLDASGYFDYGIASELLPFGGGVESFIIEENSRPAGIAVVTDARYALDGCQWRFQELYLIRPARGRALARNAARALLAAHPGRWCLSVYRKNLPARRFWDALVRSCGTPVYTAPGEDGMVDTVFDTRADIAEIP